MRRIRSVVAVAAMTAAMAAFAAPAMAQDLNFDGFDDDDGFFFIVDDFDRDDFFDNDGFFGDGFQSFDQEADSGDIDQSFDVSQTGDNSNQCAGVQGVSNTGNPQNVIDLLQAASEADDFEFEEVDSSIEVSPTSETTCDQQVNQAASASG